MVSLIDDHAVDFISRLQQGEAMMSNMGSIQDPAAAAAAAALLADFDPVNTTSKRSMIDGSDDEQQDRRNSLEDPASDEFGLGMHGLGDGSDLGGRNKDDKSDTAPAWSELKTKAGKERKRLPLACIACRRKKIRCSGEKPACKHCLRSRIPCVYKVTARKAAPRTDYMAMLDKRLKRMEDRIIKVVPKSDPKAETPTSIPRAAVKPSVLGAMGSNKLKKRGADEAFGADLDHWARSSVKSRLDMSAQANASATQQAEEGRLLREGAEALPSKEMQEMLAEVYFEHIYGQAYHILHKPSYMRRLKAGDLPPVLILSVCAIAARFSHHSKSNQMPAFLQGEEWASVARDIVTKRYESPNITILTCLLILGLHEFGTCHGGRSWAFCGQAIRMAFALSLHKDLEYDPLRPDIKLSFVDREIRRRTMWACFVMDRFNSSGSDRPTFVREDTIKIQLPIKEKYFQLSIPGPTENLDGSISPESLIDGTRAEDARDNMGVAAYMIKVIALFGRIVNYLNQGGKESDEHHIWKDESGYANLFKQAEELLADLPESLLYNNENLRLHETEGMANQFLFLHITLQQCILFLSRFAFSSPRGSKQQDVPMPFIAKFGKRAFLAANRISELLKDAEAYMVAAPFIGYCAFLSSTVHIFGMFTGGSDMENSCKRNLATNIKFLGKMKRFWGMFYFMVENLRDQYKTCADAQKSGSQSMVAAVSAIFQYGDWFDRYPHGVSHSDFVDPMQGGKKEKGDDAVLEQKPGLHTVEEFFTTLSPQGQDGNGSRKARKASSARKGSLQRQMSNMDALVANLTPEELARLSRHGNNPTTHYANTMAAQRTAHEGQYQQGSMAPVSPVAQFSNAHGQQNPASYYSHQQLLALQLAQSGQMNRSMGYDATGLEGFGDSSSLGLSLDGMDAWDSNNRDLDDHRRQNSVLNGHGGSDQSLKREVRQQQQQQQGAASMGGNQQHGDFLQDANSAWIMPFNLQPPEVGDLSNNGLGSGIDGLDGFGGIFGNGR